MTKAETIMLELTEEIRKLREAIKPPEVPGVPAFLRVQEYYRIVAKKRINVLTTGKGEPYVIPDKKDPKILLLIPWGDDVQVEFDAEVAEDSAHKGRHRLEPSHGRRQQDLRQKPENRVDSVAERTLHFAVGLELAVYDTVQRSVLGRCYLTSRGFALTHAVQVTVAYALVVKYGGLAEAEAVYNLVITKYDGHSEAEATHFIGTKYDGLSEAETIYNFAGTKYDGYCESTESV